MRVALDLAVVLEVLADVVPDGEPLDVAEADGLAEAEGEEDGGV